LKPNNQTNSSSNNTGYPFNSSSNKIFLLLEDNYFIMRNDSVERNNTGVNNSYNAGNSSNQTTLVYVQQAYKFINNNLVFVGQKILKDT
jgi:hypothetical protein